LRPFISASTSKTRSSSFRSVMIGREFEADTVGGYRFGFNGNEMDDETYGDGNEMDFGARIYDGRLGRWMSVDPLIREYPYISSYSFALNNPTLFLDPDGNSIIIYFMAQDPQDPTKTIETSYAYNSGLPEPDNEFVKNCVKAIDYIIVNDKTNTVKNISESTRNDVNIYESNKNTSYTEPLKAVEVNTRTGEISKIVIKVHWNSKLAGLNLTENVKSSGSQTPSTVLFHEIVAHCAAKFRFNTIATLSEYLGDKSKIFFSQMSTKEDQQAVLFIEPEYIRNCNLYETVEGKRTGMTSQKHGNRIDHQSTEFYQTNGVNSIIPSEYNNDNKPIDVYGNDISSKLTGTSKPEQKSDNTNNKRSGK